MSYSDRVGSNRFVAVYGESEEQTARRREYHRLRAGLPELRERAQTLGAEYDRARSNRDYWYNAANFGGSSWDSSQSYRAWGAASERWRNIRDVAPAADSEYTNTLNRMYQLERELGIPFGSGSN